MNTKTSIAIMAIVIASLFSQAQGSGVERSVEGAWLATLTPRNCITGVSFPEFSSEVLFTFHRGGTMSVWAQNALITTTRSPSHGVWKRNRGWSDYSFKFIHLRYDLGGFYVGTQESSGTLALGPSGNGFTTDSSTTLFDVDGNLLGTGCADTVGRRIELDP